MLFPTKTWQPNQIDADDSIFWLRFCCFLEMMQGKYGCRQIKFHHSIFFVGSKRSRSEFHLRSYGRWNIIFEFGTENISHFSKLKFRHSEIYGNSSGAFLQTNFSNFEQSHIVSSILSELHTVCKKPDFCWLKEKKCSWINLNIEIFLNIWKWPKLIKNNDFID